MQPAACACGATPVARLGQAYNEEAFRYLLERERRCAERGLHSLLIVLVSVKRQPGRSPQMSVDAASSIFCGLWSSVRDVDLVGWFREDRVAGAILTQAPGPLAPDAAHRVGARTSLVLTDHVAPALAQRLHVKVLQLRPTRKRHLP